MMEYAIRIYNLRQLQLSEAETRLNVMAGAGWRFVQAHEIEGNLVVIMEKKINPYSQKKSQRVSK